MLYAGSLVPTKGVHTAIEALGKLSEQAEFERLHLSLVGSGRADYEAHLHKLVAWYGLEDRVSFVGRVPREEMPRILRQHDVLLFPSTGEALPRVVQEAMACGLVVIGTTAGGTREILIEGETGLTFLPGDADGLACQIERLNRDPDLFQRLAAQGRDLIVRQFDIQKTLDGIETYLLRVVNTPHPAV